MRNVVRLISIAALAGVTAIPALAGVPAADVRDVVKITREEGSLRREAPILVAEPRFASLERVLDNIASQFPGGHHIGVDGPMPIEGRWIYRIKWLMPDGRVLIIFADAQNGQILRVRG